MRKHLFFTLAIIASYTSFLVACGCEPLALGELTMKEFNNYDIVVRAIVKEVSGPALRKDTLSENHYQMDARGEHQHEMSPTKASEISLEITESIKGEAKEQLTITMKHVTSRHVCSFNKVKIGKSYYFFLNEKNAVITIGYTTRLLALKPEYKTINASIEYLKRKLDNNELGKLEQRNTYYYIDQFEKSLKRQKEVDVQNLNMIKNVIANTSTQWYNHNNKLEAIGKLVNGTPDGEWKYLLADYVHEKGSFKKGKRHGDWTQFNENGQVSVTKKYKQGLLEGKYTQFYPNGVIQTESVYKSGKREGVLKYFSAKGELTVIEPYKRGKRHGECISYLGDGAIILTKTNYAHGVREGTFVSYFESGVLKNKMTFKNNLHIGKYYFYFPNGSIRQEGQYNDKGIRFGTWKYYNDDGSTRKVEVLDENGNNISIEKGK